MSNDGTIGPGSVPAPAFGPDPRAPRRTNVQRKPEWVRQSWLHHFLERVVLLPAEIRGIDQAHAGQANDATRMMALGRGIKPGTPDHWVFQNDPFVVVVIEIKHMSSASPAQQGTAVALRRCGVQVVEDCRTTADALCGLRKARVRLHGNADNLAVEYQARMDASLRELAARKKKPARKRSGGGFGGGGDSKARVRKAAAIYARVLLG